MHQGVNTPPQNDILLHVNTPPKSDFLLLHLISLETSIHFSPFLSSLDQPEASNQSTILSTIINHYKQKLETKTQDQQYWQQPAIVNSTQYQKLEAKLS